MEQKKESTLNLNYNNSVYWKFILFSLFGVFMFLCPVPYDGAISTPVGVISDQISKYLSAYLPYVITPLIILSAVIATITLIFKPKSILKNKLLNSFFNTSLFYVVCRIVGAIFAVMALYKIGFEAVYSGSTGGTMVSLVATLVIWFFAASFLIPFLTKFGVMEFIGTLFRVIVKPLFTVPGRSAIDLVTSWLSAASVGVIITRNQYDTGYYSGREAAVISTCFSIVSLPFCLVIAAMVGLSEVFVPFYLTLIFCGAIIAMIIPRIPPLSLIPDTYAPEVGKQIDETVPEDVNLFKWAVNEALTRAESTEMKTVFYDGLDMFLNIIFGLTPLVVAWGTLGLMLVEFTPIFDWISIPMAYYLQLFGVPEAFAVAPATIAGFADMFIPAILVKGIEFELTRWVIGALSLVQIIYLTEVGALIIASNIPLNLKDLFIIFLERTIIAIPILVIMGNIVLR